MATTPTGRKRILTRDLDVRITAIEEKLGEIADHLAKLDERIQKIADSVAQQALRV